MNENDPPQIQFNATQLIDETLGGEYEIGPHKPLATADGGVLIIGGMCREKTCGKVEHFCAAFRVSKEHVTLILTLIPEDFNEDDNTTNTN